jgi:photosystem II stability/assembly factor-like uncharacterized protein
MQSFPLALLAMLFLLVGCSSEPAGISLDEFSQKTHIHGLALDPSDSNTLLVATHHGLHAVGSDRRVRQVSNETHDFMGFSAHPDETGLLFASGHPARGGNLGVMVSSDGGERWEQRSPGVEGPVDFHQMTISEADPDVLYGAYAGRLQVSHDGGHQWQVQADLPSGLIALAASSRDAEHLYAATQSGLLMSPYGGLRWRLAHPRRNPVSLIVSSNGELYAFMVGVGLLRADEASREWELASGDWGENYLMHLAVDPSDSDRLVAADDQGLLWLSDDAGQNWSAM